MTNLKCPSNNLNYLNQTKFQVGINRLPNISFFCQTIALPGVTRGGLAVPTPLTDIMVPDDKLNFEPLNLTFIVDSDLSNWLEVFRWMQGLGFPESYEQYRTENARYPLDIKGDLPKNYSEAKLVLYDAHGCTARTINFIDCFPTALGGVSLDSTVTDITYPTASLTLEYTYFTVE